MILPGSLAVVIAPRGVALLLELYTGPICKLQEGSVAMVVGIYPDDCVGKGALFMAMNNGMVGWVRRYNLRFV